MKLETPGVNTIISKGTTSHRSWVLMQFSFPSLIHTVGFSPVVNDASHMLSTVSTVSLVDITRIAAETVETVPEGNEPTLTTGLKPRCE